MLAAAVPEARRPALRRRIEARAAGFDIGALLVQIERAGVPREDITFRANPDTTHGPGIVHGVAFFEVPQVRAEVTLNLGISGPNGLVPTYFHEIAFESPDPDRVEAFLQYFDHPVLSAWVDALYPEHPTGAQAGWRSLVRASFSMLGPGSIATLEWLMAMVFPELRVAASRTSIPMPTDAFALHAGAALLDGSGVLGVVDAPKSAGLRVDLYVEDEETSTGKKWIDLCKERLRRVALPLLRPYALTLEVVLNVLDHGSWATLENRRERDPTGRLGYDRIQGEVAGHQAQVFVGPVHEVL